MIRRRRRDDERGAVLVEMTLIVPILMTLVLGMFEVGMAWSASQGVVQASRSGARTVSQMGTYARADEEALRAVLATFGDDVGQVQRVSIYEYDETAPNGVHPDCGTSAVPTSGPRCNTYLEADFDEINDPAHFASDVGCLSTQASNPWCPITRNNSQATATLIGVEVEFAHTPVSGFFGVSDQILTQRIVMKIEPRTS